MDETNAKYTVVLEQNRFSEGMVVPRLDTSGEKPTIFPFRDKNVKKRRVRDAMENIDTLFLLS